MEHLTTLNLPGVHNREDARQQLSAQIAQFLTDGGDVQQLEITARTPEPKGNLRDRPRTVMRINNCSRRELERRDQELAKRAKALAAAGLAGDRIRKKLGFGPITFEQFIARHSIRLPRLRSKA